LIAAAASRVVLAAFEGTLLSQQEKNFFRRFPVSGVTLFKRNISLNYSRPMMAIEELRRLQDVGEPSQIVAIDQEGGRVSRMPPGFPNQGAALRLAGGLDDKKSLAEIQKYGRAVGRELLTAGINVNFAPVCDVLTEPSNLAIGDRVFSLEPESASHRAGAFLDGLEQAGVTGCLKHFPGQGDADADTHLNASYIHNSHQMMWQRELVPFQNLIPRSKMVMISHCIFSDLDSKPASLSKIIQTHLLRGKLRFEGLVVSDDMNMHAVDQDTDLWCHSLCQAILAGTDLILICRDVDRIAQGIGGIIKEATSSKVFRTRLLEAARHVMEFRSKL